MRHFTKTVEDMYPVLEPHLHPMDRGAFGDEFLRTKNYYEWLASIAWELQPTSILEIGVRFGYGAISMLWGVAKGKPPTNVIYVGIDDESAESGSNVWAQEEIKKFTDLVTVTKKRTEHLHWFDLAYVDGDHHPDVMLRDLDYVARNLGPRSTILVDDVTFIPSLYKPAMDWGLLHGFDVEWLPTHRGLFVLSER